MRRRRACWTFPFRHVVQTVNPHAGETILDLAVGGQVQLPGLPFVAGDGMKLPFAENSFDAVTISFGLRNIVDPVAGLGELLRVAKPGGRLVVCEFSTPTWGPVASVYSNYLMRLLPGIAKRVSSNPESYVYLAEPIRSWPNQRELATKVADAGWADVTWQNLSAGIVALHQAVKPR